MARIFITGIAGFLGSHLAEHLMNQGHEVWGCDNLMGGDRQNLSWVPPLPFNFKYPEENQAHAYSGISHWCKLISEDGRLRFYQMDCRDFEGFKTCNALDKVDVLYHCACTAAEGLSSFSPAYIADNTYQASVSVFSAAIAAGVKKIVFLSSMARYGEGDFDGPTFYGPPFQEGYDCHPVDPYGIAKVAAEQTLKVLCNTHGVKYQIAVPHNIIGPRQRYVDPYRNVASIFLNRLKQDKPGYIYGDGSHKRCFSPVQDILPCLAALGLDDSLPNGEVWNIGPDQGEITIAELYAKCCDAVGIPVLAMPAIPLPDRPNEVPHAYCTADKARASLGYLERASLAQCLREMADAIPMGGKPFIYDNYPQEIVTDAMPATWKERLM